MDLLAIDSFGVSDCAMETPTEIEIGAGQNVPMVDVAAFVRQLSHDLRNHLNALALQSAFINEIAADAEVKEEVQRLRRTLTQMTRSLQQLSVSLAPARLTRMSYEALSFIGDLQGKVSSEFPEQSNAVEWKTNVGSAMLQIDPQILQQALLELFANAFQHERSAGPLRVEAKVADEEFLLALQEPKTSFSGSLDKWGREPFRNLTHGHYGLGLHRVRTIIEAHGGRLEVRYDSGFLLTTIALPLEISK